MQQSKETPQQTQKEGESVAPHTGPKIERTIPDPNFVGMNPPDLLVDKFGSVYKPVIGGEPTLAGYIDPDGRFHRAIIGGLPSPNELGIKE